MKWEHKSWRHIPTSLHFCTSYLACFDFQSLVVAILYDAQICTFYGNCEKPNCRFFHLCRDFVIGCCSFGSKCRYVKVPENNHGFLSPLIAVKFSVSYGRKCSCCQYICTVLVTLYPGSRMTPKMRTTGVSCKVLVCPSILTITSCKSYAIHNLKCVWITTRPDVKPWKRWSWDVVSVLATPKTKTPLAGNVSSPPQKNWNICVYSYPSPILLSLFERLCSSGKSMSIFPCLPATPEGEVPVSRLPTGPRIQLCT